MCSNNGDIYFAIRNGGTFKNGQQIFNNSKRDLIGSDSNFHSSDETKTFFKKQNIKNIRDMVHLSNYVNWQGIIDIYPRFWN